MRPESKDFPSSSDPYLLTPTHADGLCEDHDRKIDFTHSKLRIWKIKTWSSHRPPTSISKLTPPSSLLGLLYFLKFKDYI